MISDLSINRHVEVFRLTLAVLLSSARDETVTSLTARNCRCCRRRGVAECQLAAPPLRH